MGLVRVLKLTLERAFTYASLTRSVVESAPNNFLLIDEASRILAANAATDRLFGHVRSELLGKHFGVLIPETSLRDSEFDGRKAAARENGGRSTF